MNKKTATTNPIRDRISELIRVRAGDLLPNEANWRRHPDHQRAALRSLLDQIGYADALLARRRGNELVLIDGHLRQSLDPDQLVPVLVLDVDEAEADLLLATLDPLASLATPDPEVLERLLAGLHTSDDAVLDLLQDLARSAGISPVVGNVDPDSLPEDAEPRTVTGQVWSLGAHRMGCGDARDPEVVATLMGTDRAQVLWTDPPYGVDYVGKTAKAMRIRGDGLNELPGLLREVFATTGAVLAEGAAIYMAHPSAAASIPFLQAFVDQGWRMHQTLIWEKDSIVVGHTDYHYRHEPIAFGYAPGGGRRGRGRAGWYGGNAEDSILHVPRPAASREHPTMKPVELIRRCLENSSRASDVVLDPFAGSGSTLIACELIGRRARVVELDPPYCDVILARWERLTGLKAVCDEPS